MDEENQGQLAGNIDINQNQEQTSFGSEQYRTSSQQNLEEPVIETILRDLKQIGYKLKYVLMPKMREDKGKELRNWDLWGPLLLCLLLALTLSISSSSDSDNDTIFSTIFVIIWVGAGIVTLNAKLLGGKISFFQSVCVLGYCVFPINICAIVNGFIGQQLFIIKFLLCLAAFLWSSFDMVNINIYVLIFIVIYFISFKCENCHITCKTCLENSNYEACTSCNYNFILYQIDGESGICACNLDLLDKKGENLYDIGSYQMIYSEQGCTEYSGFEKIMENISKYIFYFILLCCIGELIFGKIVPFIILKHGIGVKQSFR
ncbi:hypothetical protein PPERSA_01615 [Pseudocohnilembus persalinus]|uniref:Protein YIPF n=1 Tax=Pseudocohnilembus persalinus TaxID=266149 RepID=A0A0V0QHJ2_PSEPJ|nr:hypothetical protein PPERSA_01615 [Pseudocohnilembus persalinus]|eukprot:KRX01745.1 hypothetical protein PPERSA_01615 [Pseudocohnilembus persalinus]